jgi:activator of HSP90 ATPase
LIPVAYGVGHSPSSLEGLEYLAWAASLLPKYELDHILFACSDAVIEESEMARFHVNKTIDRICSSDSPNRRQMLAATAITLSSLAAGLKLHAAVPQSTVQTPATEEKTRTSLHQEIEFKASPRRLYEALLDSKQFAAFSGLSAEIDPKAGGAFSLFQGVIIGRNIELVPDQRIVQAWRAVDWSPGIYSLARFEFEPSGQGTTLLFDHSSFPPGGYNHLLSGWNTHYWEPLKQHLAK